MISNVQVMVEGMNLLIKSLAESEAILRAIRAQYTESALAYSVLHLRKDPCEKNPGTMKQIIFEHLGKLQTKLPAPVKEGDPPSGESQVQSVLLDNAKKFV